MTKSLPIFALLPLTLMSAVVCGQAPSSAVRKAAENPPTVDASSAQGDALMEQVVNKLDEVPSVSAKIRHRIELMGQTLIGTGDYVQQGRGPQRAFRLNLQLRTTLSATSIEQVCDGRRFWVHEEMDGNEGLTFVDLRRLGEARPKSHAPQQSASMWMTLGGLPKFVQNLHQAFQFGEVVQSQLDDLLVWTIEGHWTRERLIQLLPEQAETINSGGQADLNQLTPNAPHRVVVHVGSDDLFPYRIEFWRTDTGMEGEQLEPVQKLMALMEWYEVRLGTPVDAARFVYRVPENMLPTDVTKRWLDRFGLEDPPPAEARRRGPPRR